MKSLKKIIALTLAMTILVTSSGFSMDIHLCQGKLKSVALFGEAQTCHEKTVACPMHGTMKVNAKKSAEDCCSNVKLEVEDLDAEYNLSLYAEWSEVQLVFLSAFVDFFIAKDNIPTAEIASFPDIPDLSVNGDIYVLNEAFLL